MWLAALLFTFYVGYNPYMADLANPGVPDAMFILLFLAALDCLRHKDGWGWAVAMTLASLVLYAGAVLLALMLAAAWWWRPIERKETLRWAFRAGLLLLAVTAFYLAWGGIEGTLPAWLDTADIEYLNDYLAAVPRWKSAPLFAGYFLIGCGGVAAAGLVLAFRRGAWQRTVATTVLLYLLVVLGSGFKNLHYLGPLLPIPVVLLLSCAAVGGKPVGWKTLLVTTCSSIVCIALCWPVQTPTFTLNRQLGRQTTVRTDDYMTAVRWARLRYAMKQQGLMSWDCDQHTWAAYAELDPQLSDPRPLVLTDKGPPGPAYRLVPLPHEQGKRPVAELYVLRHCGWLDWLCTRNPPGPLLRYPKIFIPLADGVFSPHNNLLEDVPRLRRRWD